MSRNIVVGTAAGFISATLLVSVLWAQPSAGGARNSTSVAPDHRYELVQSNVTRLFTIRIDRYTGKTYQLVERSSRKTWEEIRMLDGQKQLKNLPLQVNFQVLASVLVGQEIYMWNVDTGVTWILNREPDRGKLFWRQVDDPTY